MRPGILLATIVAAIFAGISTWLSAAEYVAIVPDGDFRPHEPPTWTLTGPGAKEQRLDALRRATFSIDSDDRLREPAGDPLRAPVPSCRFAPSPPSGTTPKFDCVFPGGEIIKVKYGHDPEIHSEVAATALLRMLNYAADDVTIVPRLRCYGCPRHPFVAMHLRQMLFLPLVRNDIDDGYTDFEWVSLERKLPAPAIETTEIAGWSWAELVQVQTAPAEVDAFRLLAVFLAHWDNKSENQRLVCLDGLRRDGGRCERPVAMIQDAGASFGPTKVNLARWRDLPIWHDRASCMVSMRALPFDGATFEDVRISEAGRALLAARLGAIPDERIERLFADARFPQFQAGTDDERDLKAWTDAFRGRRRQIAEARCPVGNAGPHTASSQGAVQ